MPDSEFGSDGQLHDTNKPLSQSVESKPFAATDPFAASEPGADGQRMGLLSEAEPASTPNRLRAFEDKVLGKDHMRHDHQPEKGVGSPFSLLHSNDRAHHAALENLIAVEKEHAEAEAHMGAVHAKLEAAVKRAASTEEAL